MEGVRKRFKNANHAIFKLTGVYFQTPDQGLKDWGIKKPAKESKEQKASRSASPTTDGEWTSFHLDGRLEHAVYRGDVVAVQLKSPSDSRSSVRICDASLIPAYDKLITYEELFDENDQPYIEAIAPFLPFSAKAFDHWHFAACLSNDQGFPKQTLVCKQIDDNKYMLRVNSKAHEASAGLLLQTYVVSQAMGTTETSSMIFAELKKKLDNPLIPDLGDHELECLRHLDSHDPAREVVHSSRWRTAGSSPSSDLSDQNDDDDF
ncbi:hypothetical protein E8E11_002545 [Didymella keratinophila]|nr:hypothetical protein E8E11_002545 [Didymella keratinophila]